MELRGIAREADVRIDRSALLREAGHVEHGHALSLDVRGHAEDGADRHDARAADAGDEHAEGAFQ